MLAILEGLLYVQGDIGLTIEQVMDILEIDMESAAIAQVCYLDNRPFIIIRSISDKPNGNNEITFEEFLVLASKRCAMILQRFIEK